jgi:peptidoglycan/xylan/chitin deacetylase (PgdA/CDA1 family)
MCAVASRSVTETELVRICVGSQGLPESAEWAAGMWVNFPAALARRVASRSLDEPDTRALARATANELRMIAAYTPDPPISARLPVNYRRVPGPARRLVARAIGRVQWARRSTWSRFPGWPIDLSADVAADLAGRPSVSFSRTPVLLTHDIDSAEGLENLVRMFLSIEEAVGARSANYLVPCAWSLDHALIQEVVRRGHEIGVHGYDHANRTPFLSAQNRLQRLSRGREFGDRYGAIGYRAPSLLRTRELLTDLAPLYCYDSSIPTSGGPFPVPNNGCASGRPWRIGEIWEIPVTLPRDGSLQFLGYSPDSIARLWQETAQIAARSGAIVSLLTHCESSFSGNARMLAAYRVFIEFVAASAKFEFVRPCELVARIQGTSESI